MSSATELAADPRVRRGMAALLKARRERIAAGERPLGWKLGFGSAAAMEALGTAAPLVGFLTGRSLLDAAREASIAGFTRPMLEPEVAVRIGADLDPGGGLEPAGAAIAALSPAFELADVDPSPEDVEAILAGNVFHRGLVLGAESEGVPAPQRLRAVVEDADGTTREVEHPQGATGPIVGLIRHVADMLGEFGETLEAGAVVICGSIVPPIPVAPGDSVAYRLEPVGEISIRFGE